MAMRAEARAWWAEVEGERMRERIERRRLAAEQLAATRRRHPLRRPAERIGARPDRLASWAVGLSCLLLFVALASGHG